ncbi:pyridoxal phosphate-dependent aminotransferase [Flaviflagellibacter deserti]|uniref:aspartate transaminase n=1 Tax=Flaviflagellibacter deserti TaxID=2267266 RepID=A0ABV9Z587_9HYPH
MSHIEDRARRLLHAQRADVAPFLAMDVASAAQRLEASGRSVIHMEIGEPGFAAPRAAREAAIGALQGTPIGYTHALGMPALRARISKHYTDAYGLSVPAERIAVTTGSSSGFVLAFLALFDVGDRVAISSPGYPPYKTILGALGLIPVEIETGPDSRWALDGEAIEKAHREAPLSGVLLMSPANPSGTIVGREALEDIVATCRRLGIRLISDEIYHGLSYGEPAETALRFGDDVVVVNSFSKYWCMTGWRIGWLVVPEALERPIERLGQNLFISAPTLSQIAATAALDATEELEAIKAIYARNRSFLLTELPKIGFDKFLPADGAFYIYADVTRQTNDSPAFARAMLEEAGVAATPGNDFDRARGHRFLRFSFAGAEADIGEAIGRLRDWMK